MLISESKLAHFKKKIKKSFISIIKLKIFIKKGRPNLFSSKAADFIS